MTTEIASGSVDADVLRYFPPASAQCPTFVGDSEWHPLVDGARYLPELGRTLRRAGPGDSVLIAGLELDPELDLDPHLEPDPDVDGDGRPSGAHEPLGRLLARLAADGVDVRIVLANRVVPTSMPGTLLGGFRATAVHAATLRALRVGAQRPLAGRVLLDYSGAPLGSNHQKAVVCRVGGELVGFVGGIDLVTDRFDGGPHDRLRLDGRRWGWHDIAVRVRGRAAEQVWHALRERWIEAATLPRQPYLRRPTNVAVLNPERAAPDPGPADSTPAVESAGTAVRVLRSVYSRKLTSPVPWHWRRWDFPEIAHRPRDGVHEVFDTLVHAIGAARRYVYLEDQYLSEAAGGSRHFELYPALRAAAARGVKVIMLGSGTRDPEDTGVHLGPINRALNGDLRRKIVDRLPAEQVGNVVVHRLEQVTVHAKLVLVDDVFACIGSANMFSRSMMGTDSELSAAVATTTSLVRDLRVAVWGEHLRAPLTDAVRAALEDLDLALGIWRTEWAGTDPLLWRSAERPAGFRPTERVLSLIGP